MRLLVAAGAFVLFCLEGSQQFRILFFFGLGKEVQARMITMKVKHWRGLSVIRAHMVHRSCCEV